MNTTTVLLEPLSATETDELIDELLVEASAREELRERIRAAAEGNPLFVEQMLAMVEESPGEVSVPSTIQALLAARLDQLPAQERAALERGAVEGQVFHRSAVVALAPDDPDVPSRLMGLVRKELVRPSRPMLPGDDAFRFRHLLIRDAAYDALPKAERAALHERFAVWLEEHAPTLVELDEIVGYHLEQAARYQAELGRPAPELQERAALRLAAAGLRAGERHDPNACVNLLTRAAALFDDGDERRLTLLPTLGQALYWLGRLDDAYRCLDEAAALGDPDIAAYAFFFRAYMAGHAESGSPTELEPSIRARLASVERVASERTLASGHLSLGWMLYWQGRLEGAIEEGQRAVELARRAGDRRVEWEGLRLVGTSKMHGDVPWEEVERHADEMEAAGVTSTMVRGFALGLQARFDEASVVYEEGVRELLEHGQVLNALIQRLWYGRESVYYSGDLERAEDVLRDGWVGLGQVGEHGYRSTIGCCLAEIVARQGRLDEAATLLEEAMSISSEDDWVTVAQHGLVRGLVASGRGDHDLACDLALGGVQLADAREYLTLKADFRLTHAEILRAAGRLDEARAELLRAREVAERKGSTAVITKVDALLADLH
jgi:tetratricopeptide (TPR) repeat protein